MPKLQWEKQAAYTRALLLIEVWLEPWVKLYSFSRWDANKFSEATEDLLGGPWSRVAEMLWTVYSPSLWVRLWVRPSCGISDASRYSTNTGAPGAAWHFALMYFKIEKIFYADICGILVALDWMKMENSVLCMLWIGWIIIFCELITQLIH